MKFKIKSKLSLQKKFNAALQKQLDKRVEKIKVKYRYIKVIPDSGIRNTTTENIAKAICALFKTPKDRTTVTKKKNGVTRFKKKDKFFKFYSIEMLPKVSYILHITKQDVEFIFQVPDLFYKLFEQKIYEVWPKSTANEIKYNPTLNIKDASCYSLSNFYDDALSFDIDKRSNDPLSGILNVIDNMEEGEEVIIINNFIPMSQNSWAKRYDKTMDKIRDKKVVEKVNITRGKVLTYADAGLTLFYKGLCTLMYDGVGSIINIDKSSKNKNIEKEKAEELRQAIYDANNRTELKDHSYETKNKGKLPVLESQVLIISKASNKIKRDNNAIGICNSYRIIDGNNKIYYGKVKLEDYLNLTDLYLPQAYKMILSVAECNNFIQLPGDDILKVHPQITNKKYEEIPVPEDMLEGYIFVGNTTYRGKPFGIYMNRDEELKNLGLVILGPPRMGKSTYKKNFVYDAVMKAGECVVQFDFIKTCEDAKEVSSVLPPDKVINIDCGQYSNVFSFDFNELDFRDDDEPIFKYQCIKNKTALMVELVDNINLTDDMRARMEKYFEAACNIVFSTKGSVKEIFDCLQDHVKRATLIHYVPTELKNFLEPSIRDLGELDKYPENTKAKDPKPIGTNTHLISGIINRMRKLQKNIFVELCLKEINKKLDFTDLLQKPVCVNILIPKSMFPTDEQKDIFCTFMYKKIIAGLDKRELLYYDPDPKLDKRIKVNLMIDEIYQTHILQLAVAKTWNQVAKFRFKPIICAHNFDQLETSLAKEVINSAPDVLFLQNCTEDVFKPFIKRIKTYTADVLVNIPQYHALALLKTNKGNTISHIVKLPGKLSERYKKINCQ